MVKVLKAGFYSTVQDIGRIGHREFGVPVSGAMDDYSAQMANALVGNDKNAAVLEITLTGPKLQFMVSTSICISGADMSAKLNGNGIQNNHPISIKANDVLSFGKLNYGCRAYIAVSGGFKTEMVMNSRSFYPHITSKSSVEDGDALQIELNTKPVQKTNASIKFNNALFSSTVLQAYKGPEYKLLSKVIQKKLSSEEFTVSKNNNRMGYQLEETLDNKLPSILTSPVLPGTVQLTPSGTLIVLMKDGQTTGGYPRVLKLKEASINVLAQKKASDLIQFMVI